MSDDPKVNEAVAIFIAFCIVWGILMIPEFLIKWLRIKDKNS